jgi:hypothetical protein
MIFVKVDVDLPTHHRVLAIAVQRRAECLGTYLVALAFSRRNELDGYVPSSAIEQLGPKTRRRTVPELLRVGLLEADGDGYRITKYAKKNETKSEISARREEWARRQDKRRAQPPVTRDTARDTRPWSQTQSKRESQSQSKKVETEPDPEGERERAQARARPPFGDPEQRTAEQQYACAWAQGIEQTTGSPCAPPTARWELGAINRATLTHFKGQRGEDLLTAIRRSAAEYAQRHAGRILKAENWLAWLNSNRPAAASPPPPRLLKATQQPFDENAPWFKDAGETE